MKHTNKIILLTGSLTTAILLLCVYAFVIWIDVDTPYVPFIAALHERNEPCAEATLSSIPWDKGLFDSLYARAAMDTVNIDQPIKGGVVPHHLLAGHLDATFFEALRKQKPSTIVLVGPDHFYRGTTAVTTLSDSWNTPYGTICTDRKSINALKRLPFVTENRDVFRGEHSMYSVLPFIQRSLPEARVIPLTLRIDTSEEEILALTDQLVDILPKDAVIVASVDFSHYLTAPVSEFHDERTRAIIRSFDYDRIASLEIDSPPSIALFLRLMDAYDTEHVAAERSSNASIIVGKPSAENITSYYTPFFVAGQREESAVVSMLSVGDIMLDRAVASVMGPAGLDTVLQDLAGEEGRFFRGIDIVSGNLEGPFVENRINTSKEIAFRFDPALVPALRAYGFTHLSLANNHTYDMGRAGLPETESVLEKAGIAYYGHPYEVTSSSLRYDEIDGVTIAFIGFNDTFSSLDDDVAVALVQKAEAHADLTVLNIHWGIEYQGTSSVRQRSLAHKLVDAGADIVIGHHPHVVQEMEIYNNRPIFYSLGNFLFDQYFSKETQEGLAIGAVFYDTVGVSVYVYPLKSERSVVRQMTYSESNEFMQQFVDKSTLGTYTFDKYHHLFIPYE